MVEVLIRFKAEAGFKKILAPCVLYISDQFHEKYNLLKSERRKNERYLLFSTGNLKPNCL